MEYLPQIITVAGIHLLAAMSPGPDFIMLVKNSLVHSRRSGFYSAVGLGFGVLTHIIYCLAGIAIVISQSILLFNVIKIVGAGYLIYIGIRAIIAKSEVSNLNFQHKADLSPKKSFLSGYITNVTNPKATLFFLSLFTLVISPDMPFAVKLIMSLEMTIVTILWFALLSYLISHPAIKNRFVKVQQPLERFMGGILVLLGIKVALSHSK